MSQRLEVLDLARLTVLLTEKDEQLARLRDENAELLEENDGLRKQLDGNVWRDTALSVEVEIVERHLAALSDAERDAHHRVLVGPI